MCLLALGLRLIVIWQCADATLYSDMLEYWGRAIYLRDHGQLFPDAFRPPAYPTFLTGFIVLFGDHALSAARIGQSVLGAATVGLAGLLARRLAGARAGIAAAMLLAVYPAWLLYPVYIMAETLFAFLTIVGIWLWTQRGYATAALAGAALALSVQSRAVGIATVAGIGLAALLDVVVQRRDAAHGTGRDWQRPLRRGTVLAAAFAGTMSPSVIRNVQIRGAFIPTDTASGYNFLLGNNPLATGRLELDQLDAITTTYWADTVTDVDRSNAGFAAGMAFIRAEPRAALVLAARKLGYLVGLEGREHAWTYGQHYHGRRASATVWSWGVALLASFPIVMLAALIGMARPGALSTSLGRTIVMVLLTAALVHLASFGESRFHLPWVPLLAVMAGAAWSDHRVRAWSWPRQAALGAAVAALTLLWLAQAPALLDRLARLASSPVPLQLPY